MDLEGLIQQLAAAREHVGAAQQCAAVARTAKDALPVDVVQELREALEELDATTEGLRRQLGAASRAHAGEARAGTERARQDADGRALAPYERLLERLADLAQAVGAAQDLQTIFRALLDFVVASTPSNGLFASLYDPEAQQRVCVFASSEGQEIDVATLPPLPMTDSPHSRAVATGQIVVTDDFQAAMTGKPRVDLSLEIDPRLPRSSLAAPMVVMGRVIGGFEIQSVHPAAYTQEHIITMRMAANLAAIAVANVQLLERERGARSAVEASEQRFRALVQNASDIVLVVAVDGTIRYASPSIHRLLGYPPAELIGNNVLAYVHPADRKRAERLLHPEAVEVFPQALLELRLRHQNGSWRQLEAVAANVVHNASVGGIVVNARDITERKRAVQRLAVQQAASRVLLEAVSLEAAAPRVLQCITEGLDWLVGALWLVDRDSEVLRCGAIWHAELIQATAFASLSRQTAFARGEGWLGRVWATGEPAWLDDLHGESSFVRRQAAVEAGLRSACAFPISGERGILGAIEFFSQGARPPDDDLLQTSAALSNQIGQFVERKQAEEALSTRVRQQATVAEFGQRALAGGDLQALLEDAVGLVVRTLGIEYSAVMEVLPDGETLLVRAGVGWQDGVVGQVTVNVQGQSLSGYTLMTNGPVIVADLRQETRFTVPQVLRDHGVVSSISVIVQGGERPFGVLNALTMRRRRFSHDDIHFQQAIANVLATAIQRKRIEEALQAAIAVRDDFLSVASHELKTPVTAVLAYTEVLQRRAAREPATDGRNQRALQVIREQTQRLARLINLLLDLSRIQAGRLQLERQRVELCGLLQRLVEAMGPGLARHTVEITCEKGLAIQGDDLRLEQVFQNLLQNAVKYSPGGGRVTIRGERQGAWARVAVSDEGIGIPARDQAQLFQRFFRAGNVEATGISGMGIGLFVVKEIVARHGGEVEVQSTEGSGSTFTVRLPIEEGRPDGPPVG